jgi:hypothetical protein
MANAGYAITTEGEVSLLAATAKSVLGVKAGTGTGLDLKGMWIDFNGITSSALPALVEVCYCTFATNSPGTSSTGGAERQIYGRVTAADFTAGHTWTVEPTVLTVIDAFALDPNKGLYRYDWPLGETPDSAPAEGFVIRCTAPAAVSCRAGLRLQHV